MPIIKPRGLLKGDRIAQLSDEARLYWPFVYAGSNGYGCFELDFKKITARAFAGFRQKPSRQLVIQILREYRAVHLLFLYTAPDGRRWGAWDSVASQSFHTREDNAAPKPPAAEFNAWREEYQKSKRSDDRDTIDLDAPVQPGADENSEKEEFGIGLIQISGFSRSTDINALSESESITTSESKASVTQRTSESETSDEQQRRARREEPAQSPPPPQRENVIPIRKPAQIEARPPEQVAAVAVNGHPAKPPGIQNPPPPGSRAEPFDVWFERIWRINPNKRDRHLSEQALARRFGEGAALENNRALFEKHHRLYLRTPRWCDRAGAFAPKLWQFVEDNEWEYPPPRDQPNMPDDEKPRKIRTKTLEEML